MSYTNLYTLNELADIHLVYGECHGNSCASVRRYAEKFPGRRIPHRRTFDAVDRRFREKGTFLEHTIEHGRPRNVSTPEVEEEILEIIHENPDTSIRRVSLQIDVSKKVVHRTLKEQLLKPYHLQRVHEILPGDTLPRLQFCRWFRNIHNDDNNFISRILFTDESCFTRKGVLNLHNLHNWSDENPHAIVKDHFQRQFSINIWAGIVGSCFIGPVELPPRLNGEQYLNFLQNSLPELFEDIPLNVRRDMWFMHDGAPPHFTISVRNFLHRQFPDRWIGRGRDAPVNWPARSPDITPMDFYLWSFMKKEVYATPVETREELWTRILQAADIVRGDAEVLLRVMRSFTHRINLCIENNGQQFQHLL